LRTYRRKHSFSARKALALIVGASVMMLIIPRAWSGKLLSLVQILVPFQDAATAAADSAGNVLASDSQPVPVERFEQLRLEKEAAERRLAAISLKAQQLENEVVLLTAARQWNAGGQSLGAQGKLLPARVVAQDLLPWRAARTINVGLLQGVAPGSPVTSHELSIDRGTSDGLTGGQAILLGESLVGFVDQAGSHIARVKLISDVDVQMKVRIGRMEGEVFQSQDRYYWLVGKGQGAMEIRDVEAREAQEGLIRSGDMVLSDPRSDTLPAAMAIGRIKAVMPDRDNPLFAILLVEPATSTDSLRQVYVYLRH
jgi:cell shape-determining protein MreC